MVVQECVVVELKAVRGIIDAHRAQAISYLKSFRSRSGIDLEFWLAESRIQEGRPKPPSGWSSPGGIIWALQPAPFLLAVWMARGYDWWLIFLREAQCKSGLEFYY
jgi:hypothetical protein